LPYWQKLAAMHVFSDRDRKRGGYWTSPVDYQRFERPLSKRDTPVGVIG